MKMASTSKPNESISAASVNATSASTGGTPYLQLYWILSEATLVVLTFFSIYLVISLSRFGMLTRCKPGREISGKKGKILYQLCLCASIMIMGRFAADHAVALVGWQSNSSCIISVGSSAVFYSLSLYPVYIFLWMRQSIFYANPVLSHVLNPVITCFSWGTLVVMLTGGGVLTVLYIIPDVTGWQYAATDKGCEDLAATSEFDLISTLVVVFTITFQVSLLALFMYPLLTKKTRRYRSAGAEESSNHGNGNSIVSDPQDANEKSHSESFSNPNTNDHFHMESEGKHYSLRTPDDVEMSDDAFSNDEIPPNYFHSKEVEINANGTKPSQDTIGRNSPTVVYRKNPNFSNTNTKKMKKVLQSKRSAITLSTISQSGDKSTQKSTKKRKRSKTQQGKRVMLFIRKAFLLTLVCVLSDGFFALLHQLLILPELVYLVFFDINLLINVICIIMSFRDWPIMLFPLCNRFKRRRRTIDKESTYVSMKSNGTRFLTNGGQRSRLDTINQNNFSCHSNGAYNETSPIKN